MSYVVPGLTGIDKKKKLVIKSNNEYRVSINLLLKEHPIVDSENGERGDLIIRLNLRMPDIEELKEEHIQQALFTAFPPINKKDEEAGEPVRLKNMSQEDKEKYEEDIFSEGYDEDELYSDLEDTDSDEEDFEFEISS